MFTNKQKEERKKKVVIMKDNLIGKMYNVVNAICNQADYLAIMANSLFGAFKIGLFEVADIQCLYCIVFVTYVYIQQSLNIHSWLYAIDFGQKRFKSSE